jgi:hypothetical protein
MKEEISFDDLNNGLQAIIIFIFACAVVSAFWIVFIEDINNIKDLPHRYCHNENIQTYYNTSLPCNEKGDKYFAVTSIPEITTYACEHNGERRLLIHNGMYSDFSITLDDLPKDMHYLMDNETKYVYNVKEGIVNLGVLNTDEKRLLVEVHLDERMPEGVFHKVCPDGIVNIYKKGHLIIYNMECKD